MFDQPVRRAAARSSSAGSIGGYLQNTIRNPSPSPLRPRAKHRSPCCNLGQIVAGVIVFQSLSGTHDLFAGIDGILMTCGGRESGVAAEDTFQGPDFFGHQSTPGAGRLQGAFEEQGGSDE